MLFSKEVGDRFESLSDAYIDLLQNTKFSPATGRAMAVNTLWAQTWEETKRVAN
jgi:hypothetical protein